MLNATKANSKIVLVLSEMVLVLLFGAPSGFQDESEYRTGFGQHLVVAISDKCRKKPYSGFFPNALSVPGVVWAFIQENAA
jgi:hypothetical protein